MINRSIGPILCILSGMMIGINLATMHPNPNYDASMHKVIAGLFLALLGFGMSVTKENS